MMNIEHKNTKKLKRIRQKIKNSCEGFQKNYDRFNRYRKYTFVSTLNDTQRAVLTERKMPHLEFNILESYVSRLCGQIAKSAPSIRVSGRENKKVDGEVIKIVEGHLRHILYESNKKGMEYNCYRDTLSGGYSDIKIFTQYAGERSFHVDLGLRRVIDPTLVGHDPTALEPDKSDGGFCFELIPKTLEDFEKEHPEFDTKSMKFPMSNKADGQFDEFQWSFKAGDEKIVLIADFYEKKKIRTKIHMLADGQVLTTREYNQFLEEWELSGKFEVPPIEIGDPRSTEIVKIMRYQLVEKTILNEEETDYKALPIKFIDGNSLWQKEGNAGQVEQITRPYIYNAMGAQNLKNIAGQSLANELENLGPNKTIIALESLNDKYLDGITSPQTTSAVVYNAFMDGNPNQPLPPPMMPNRPQIPPEIANAFSGADAITQGILGNFDATIAKLPEHDASGIAIQESATLSNAAAQPYIDNFLLGLQSACQMIVDLLPVYYRTPRSIPVIDERGKRDYAVINDEGKITFDYDHDSLQVNIEPGLNFEMQQSQALRQIAFIMQAAPKFAEFMGEKGIPTFFDNMNFRNKDALQEEAEKWMVEQNQLKMQMQQAEMQKPNLEQQMAQIAAKQVESEAMLGQQKLQIQAAHEAADAQLRQQQLEIDKQKVESDLIKTLVTQQMNRAKIGIEQQKADESRLSTLIDANIRASEHRHDIEDRQLGRAIEALDHIQKSQETYSQET